MSIICFPKKSSDDNKRFMALARGAISKAQSFSGSGQTRVEHLKRMIEEIKQGKR